MKFRCDRDALSEALQTVQRGVSSRPGIPALTGVLMEALAGRDADAHDDGPRGLGPAGDRGAGGRGGDRARPGPAPGRHGEEPVGRAGGVREPISRRRGSDAPRTRARCGCCRPRTSRRCRPPAGTRVVVEAPRFAEAVGQVARAASRDEARPVLTGVLVEVSREGVTLVATDSYRLAVRELVATAGGEAKAIVPERAMTRGRPRGSGDREGRHRGLPRREPGLVPGRGAQAHVATDRRRVPELPPAPARAVRQPSHRVAPAARWTPSGVSACSLATRPRSAWSSTRSASSSRRSSPDLGQAVEAVEARYEGEDITAAFNPTYLADGLAAASGETVRLEVRDGLKPGIVRGESDEFTYLVMPVRLPTPVG